MSRERAMWAQPRERRVDQLLAATVACVDVLIAILMVATLTGGGSDRALPQQPAAYVAIDPAPSGAPESSPSPSVASPAPGGTPASPPLGAAPSLPSTSDVSPAPSAIAPPNGSPAPEPLVVASVPPMRVTFPLVGAPETSSQSIVRHGWRSFSVPPPGLSRRPFVELTEDTHGRGVFNPPSFSPPRRIAMGRER